MPCCCTVYHVIFITVFKLLSCRFVFFRFHQEALVGHILQFRPQVLLESRTLQLTDSLLRVWLFLGGRGIFTNWQFGLSFFQSLVIWVFLLLILCVVGQSDTDSSDSALTQESHPGGRTEPVAIVTPHLLLSVCGLLENLLAVLPEFSLSALKHNHILQSMARLERHVKTNRYSAEFWDYLYTIFILTPY